jgi:hypothetical protein
MHVTNYVPTFLLIIVRYIKFLEFFCMLENGRIYSFYQLLAFLGEMWGTGQYDMVATNLS